MPKSTLVITLLLLALAGLAGVLVGYVDVHNDEVQAPAFLLLTTTFILGFSRPSLAWLWALMIGLGVPVAHGLSAAWHLPPRYEFSWLPGTLLPLLFGFVGAYAGAALRWVSRFRQPT